MDCIKTQIQFTFPKHGGQFFSKLAASGDTSVLPRENTGQADISPFSREKMGRAAEALAAVTLACPRRIIQGGRNCISANGEPIMGIPTATDYSKAGATVSFLIGGGIGRLPVNVTLCS
jgi:hypothetical protein